MSPVLIVNSLGKRYRRYASRAPTTIRQTLFAGRRHKRPEDTFWAIDNVSFELDAGEALGLVGSNGAGKTTLLRLIGGVIKPDRGSVQTNGTLGGLLQMTAGFRSDLTGRDNLYVAGLVRGMRRTEIHRAFADIVEFAGLETFIDEPIRTYSTGMRMRLAFSVAIHAPTDLLLVDEALAVGDAEFRAKCQARLAELRSQGCALVIASHQTQVIERFCTAALWLHAGQAAGIGEPAPIVNEYLTFLNSTDKRPAPGSRDIGRARRHCSLARVALEDDTGNELSEVGHGDPMNVRIELANDDCTTDLVLNVSVGPRGKPPLGTMQREWRAQDRAARKSSSGGIALRVDRLDLAPGDYMVYVAVHAADWSVKHDAARRIFSLTGTETGNGPLLLPHIWSHE
jgi:lipopolysaccharide transport system ATP-binding protein